MELNDFLLLLADRISYSFQNSSIKEKKLDKLEKYIAKIYAVKYDGKDIKDDPLMNAIGEYKNLSSSKYPYFKKNYFNGDTTAYRVVSYTLQEAIEKKIICFIPKSVNDKIINKFNLKYRKYYYEINEEGHVVLIAGEKEYVLDDNDMFKIYELPENCDFNSWMFKNCILVLDTRVLDDGSLYRVNYEEGKIVKMVPDGKWWYDPVYEPFTYEENSYELPSSKARI